MSNFTGALPNLWAERELRNITAPNSAELSRERYYTPVDLAFMPVDLGGGGRSAGEYYAGVNRRGRLAWNFADDFYDRLHMQPVRIDAGTVINDTDYEVFIFNAYIGQPCVISEVAIGQPEGLKHDLDTPHTLGSLMDVVVTITFLVAGPPVQDTEIVFKNNLKDKILTVTADRMAVFPYIPKTGVREALEWLTDVMESFSGLETRESIRELPRHSMEWEVIVPDSAFNSFLRGWHTRAFSVPVWHEARKLARDLNVDDLTIYADTSYGTFVAGMPVVVWQDADYYEVFSVAEFNATGLNVVKAATKHFDADAIVMPLKNGMLDPTYKHQVWGMPIQPGKLNLNWQISDLPEIAEARQPLTYKGFDVLQKPLGMTNGAFDFDFTAPMIVTDFGTGKIEYDSRYDYNTAAMGKVRFVLDNRADIWALKQWLFYLSGKYTTFWVPTYRKDITIANDFTSGDTTLQIKNINYYRYLKDLPICKFLYFETVTGDKFIRQITGSAALDDSRETITLDANLGFTGNNDSFKYICYLLHMRLAGDRVEFAWYNPDLAEVEISLKEVALNG